MNEYNCSHFIAFKTKKMYETSIVICKFLLILIFQLVNKREMIGYPIKSIESYLDNKRDFSIYSSDKMLRRAIEREFEIIGEAMSRIERINSTIDISSKKQIISMRNRVIHGYDKIDDEIIWGIIVRHLPVLRKEIEILIKQ